MSSWKLLSETRKHCIRAALAGTAASVLLVFVQSVSGLLEGILTQGWTWIVLSVFPALLVLWANTLGNRYPSKIVHPAAHQAILWGSWTYFLLALATLLAEPFATQGQRSLQDYLRQSLWWMLPLEVILIGGYWLVFYRKDLIFKPNERIILDLAAQKASSSKDKGNLLRQQCFEMLAANDMTGVYAMLKTHFEKTGSEDLNTLVLLESQYNALLRDRDLNTIERNQAQIELNRIAMALINLVERI